MLRESLPWDSGKILHAHQATKLVAKLVSEAGVEPGAYYQQTDTSLGDLGRSDGPARPLVADRVALPAASPFFDPVPHLQAAGATTAAAVYVSPALGELPNAADPAQPHELRRCCLFSAGQERRLAERMDDAGILGLVCASEVTRPGGLFGVEKKRDPVSGQVPLRLIFDRRPRNAVEAPLRDLCATLAQGCVLCDLVLAEHEQARLWLSDLPNYY